MASWRTSKEYYEAWLEAIIPFCHDEHADLYYCALCGKIKYLGDLSRFHILGSNAYREIRMDSRNLLPACWIPCHYDYGVAPDKKSIIEAVTFPVNLSLRWDELIQIVKEIRNGNIN